MRAKDRCPEHNQGDRCVGVRGHHEIEFPAHIGNFSVWDKDRVEELYPREHRRNRLESRKEREGKNWVKAMIKNARLGLLAEIYLKPFMKKPE